MKVVAAVILALVLAPTTGAATVRATVDHQAVGLGDPFRYTVEARAASATLRVVADTGPFAVVAAPKTSRSRTGGMTMVRVE